jgi:hypothetical protein
LKKVSYSTGTSTDTSFRISDEESIMVRDSILRVVKRRAFLTGEYSRLDSRKIFVRRLSRFLQADSNFEFRFRRSKLEKVWTGNRDGGESSGIQFPRSKIQIGRSNLTNLVTLLEEGGVVLWCYSSCDYLVMTIYPCLSKASMVATEREREYLNGHWQGRTVLMRLMSEDSQKTPFCLECTSYRLFVSVYHYSCHHEDLEAEYSTVT